MVATGLPPECISIEALTRHSNCHQLLAPRSTVLRPSIQILSLLESCCFCLSLDFPPGILGQVPIGTCGRTQQLQCRRNNFGAVARVQAETALFSLNSSTQQNLLYFSEQHYSFQPTFSLTHLAHVRRFHSTIQLWQHSPEPTIPRTSDIQVSIHLQEFGPVQGLRAVSRRLSCCLRPSSRAS